MNPSALLKCINLITQISTNPNDHIAVLSDRNGFDFPAFRLNYRIELTKKSAFSTEKVNFFILDNLNETQIEYTINHMFEVSNQSWFNPTAKILFIGTELSPAILKLFAKYYIINVTFLNDTSGFITTTYPYKDKNLQRIDTKMTIIGICNESLISLQADELFPMKIPRKWDQLFIRVVHPTIPIFAECFRCQTQYKGIESEIFSIIFEYLNMSYEVVQLKSSRPISLVINFESDMAFGVLFSFYWHRDLDTTFPYLQEIVTWFVGVAPEIPRWKYIFTIFHKNVYVAVMITVLAISASLSVKTFLNERRFSLELFFAICLSPFILFLGQTRCFYVKSLHHKIMVWCIIFLSTMMNFFFGTRLSYLLNGRNYEFQIKSSEQIRENNLNIGYSNERFKQWATQTSIMRDYPEHFYVNCSGKHSSCIQRSIIQKDMVLLTPERPILYSLKNYSVETPLKPLNEYLQVMHLNAFFIKGHPLFPTINRILQYLVESGIIKRISAKYNKLLQIRNEPLAMRPLSFEHMVLPLFIWAVGILLSSAIFSYEIVRSRINGI
ncbi:hypothetical protein HHI36_022409 [Cryptolaemus montrouzieri]|uniref:Ionotropic receptor n=1 Tax=Cryptolaemus montrouzieri TaxID=559131 RepID=A0ABD2N0Z2_9CUCU